MCHYVAKRTQQEIDAKKWPPPEEPEQRLLRQISFYQDWLKDHPEAPTKMKLHVVKQITRLDVEYASWVPTKYRVDSRLKGGKSK